MSYISPKFKQTGTDLEQIGNLPLQLNDILKIKEGWIKYDAINAKFYYSSDEGATWLPIGDLQSLSQIDDVNIASLQDGQVLIYDSATSKWINTTLDALPDQTGNAGKYLTTDGTNASWAEVDALPDQTGNDGKFLKTDGTEASWVAVNLDNTAVEIAKGTRLVSASIATITDGGLTVTSPAYKAHIVDHATNTLTMAEKTTPTVLTPPDYTTPIWFAYVTAANTIQWETVEIGAPANRSLVPLMSIITNGVNAIVAVNNGTRGSYRDFNGFIQDWSLANPPQNVGAGNVITLTDPQAAGCLVNKTIGKIFTAGANVVGNTSGSEGIVGSPDYSPYASITNDQQDGLGGFINFPSARLSGEYWDNGGVQTLVGNNKWSVRPIYVGQGALVVSPLGQQVYNSSTEALNGITTEARNVNPNLSGILLLGWAICKGDNTSFLFRANANASGGGAPSVSLNLWSTRTLTNADSPFTITGSKTIYVLDTSAGNIDLVLPTIDSSIASDENRFVKAADANRVKVSVNGGTQTIAEKTEQYIWENGGAFSVVASDTLTYLITQDNRKEDTFQTPTYVWGKTGSIETYDASGSTLGTGATVTGDNHGTILTTGTTVSSVGFASVSTQEKIKEKNFFKFQYSASDSNEFQIVAQGWNGSAWVDVSASVLPIEAGNEVDGLIGFNKSTYTAFRIVVSNLTTNAGRTFTLCRGEWTDRFSELVEVRNDPVIVERSGNAGGAIAANTQDIPFGTGADLITSFTMPFNGELSVDAVVWSSETIAAYHLYKNGVQNKLLVGYSNASIAGKGGTATITAKKGEIFSIRSSVALTLSANASPSVAHWVTFTATPLSSSKGYVYQADFDRSEFEWPMYDKNTVVVTGTGYTSTKCNAIPRIVDGKILCWLSISGTFTTSEQLKTISIAGVTFLNECALASAVGSNTVSEAIANEGTNTITRRGPAITILNFNGTVELSSWPTWATKSVKPFPMNIVGPVAVANYVSAELTGYAGGASGVGGNIKFANATNALPDYLEISANKDRVTFKKAVKNVSAQGNYACTTAVAPGPILRLYNSSGVVRFEDYDAQTVTQSESKGVTLLFDANEGDYILLYKGTSAGTPLNSDATRLFVKCLDIDSALIASPAKDAHKNATYLSSAETPAGWCEFTGKTIYKRTIYFPTAPGSNASFMDVGTNLTPVNSCAYQSAYGWILWGFTENDSGRGTAWVSYNKTTGKIMTTVVSTYAIIPAGARVVFEYTKD